MEWKTMELINVVSVSPGAGVLRQTQAERPVATDKQAVDTTGGGAVEGASGKQSEISQNSGYTGKRYDYTFNVEHDLIIKVRDRNSNEEIKQIPSKETQAYRRAFREIVDKLLDIKV